MSVESNQMRLLVFDALWKQGIRVHQSRVRRQRDGSYVLEAVVSHGRQSQKIEEAQIIKEDYRLAAIRESEEGTSTK